VYDLVVCEQGGYEPRAVTNHTTLRAAAATSEQCSICMENIDTNTGVLTRCGHAFHLRCFETWNVALVKNTCPNCRDPIRDTENPHDLFSLMDVVDDPRVRAALLDLLDPGLLRVRAFSYDEGVRTLEHDIMPFLSF
jgi:hypothetical protein